MRYNVTGKHLAKKIKKDGTISKVNDIKATYKAGNIIVTNFGEFVAVGAEQIIHTSASGKQYKQWMVTLKDSSGTYKMTHNQAHKNKKMPKSAKLEQVIIAGLLPAPKELIDRLVEQVERLVKQYNQQLLSNPANYTTRGKLKSNIRRKLVQLENGAVTIVDKVIYISNILNTGIYAYKYITITQAKEIHKKLQQRYHPDRNNGATTELFQEIQDIFDWL